MIEPESVTPMPNTGVRRFWIAPLAASLIVGGWLAADRTLALGDGVADTRPVGEALAGDTDVTSLWPDSMSATEPPWQTTVATVSATDDEQPLYTVLHDRSNRLVVAQNGASPQRHEFEGVEAYSADVAAESWNPTERDESDRVRRIVSMFGSQPHVRDLVPLAAAPFVTVEAAERDGDTTRYRVTFDREAFARRHPIRAQRWHPAHFVVTWASDYEWTLDVRDDGYITRWQDPTPGMWLEWAEAPPIEFDSPLG